MNELNVCAICGNVIDRDADETTFTNFKPVHVECEREAMRIENALEYAKAWYTDFFEYLEEMLICTTHPQEQDAVKLLLEDFRDNWGGQKEFPDWIADNY